MPDALDATAVRAALAVQRATGAPWLPLAMGLERTDAGFGMTKLRARTPAGVTELAVLADFALGAALRTRLGPRTHLATLTLTLQLDSFEGGSGASVRAHAEPSLGAVGLARGEVVAGGRPAGACLATFALPTAGAVGGLPPLPWEQAEGPTAAGREPGGAGTEATPAVTPEAAAREAATPGALPDAAAGAARGAATPSSVAPDAAAQEGAALAVLERLGRDRSLADALVEPTLGRATEGPLRGRLEGTALLLNRAGHVQGGALVGLAVAAARSAARAPSAPLVSAHLLFIRAAGATALEVEASVIRAGRRAAFIRVDVNQEASLVASAQVVLGSA